MKQKVCERIAAAAMSVAMLLTPLGSVVLADAAENYYMNFVDATDKTMTTIVELGNINAVGVLPANHEFDSERPFVITDKDGTANKEDFFTITNPNRGYYGIIANAFSASGATGVGKPDPDRASRNTYTLAPKLMANISDGFGSATILNPGKQEEDGSITPVSPSHYGFTVTSQRRISVTAPSTVTIVVNRGEDPDNNIEPSFNKVADDGATGVLQDYSGKEVLVQSGSYKAEGNKRTMTVSFGTDNNAFTFSITLGSGERITSGSSLTFTYNLQDVNALTLTVVTPRQVLEDIGSGILYNATNPEVTDSKKIPYVKLSGNDQLYAITDDFQLLQKVAMYNDSVADPRSRIEWSWEPRAEQYIDVVQINTNTLVQTAAKVVPRKEDVSGYLVARPSYRLPDGFDMTGSAIKDGYLVLQEPVKLPITILGTGTTPVLVPGKKLEYNTATGLPDEIPIFELPRYMDVYNRSTQWPYEFDAMLRMGEGRGRAEKVAITVSGPTKDAVELYINSSAVPYAFGTELENDSDGLTQKQVRYVAKKQGQVTITYTFWVYDYQGKLVQSPDTIQHTLVISDSTPLDYAELSAVTLLSPTLDTMGNGNADIAAAYPGGRISYGFNSSNYVYQMVELPYLVDQLEVYPEIPPSKGISSQVKYEVSGLSYAGNSGTLDLDSTDNRKFTVPLAVDAARTITLTVTAQNGREQLYMITVNRLPPDTDSRLKSLQATDVNGNQLVTGFLPTQTSYSVTVPYATRWIKPSVVTNSLWATYSYSPTLVDRDNPQRAGEWLPLTYPGDPVSGPFSGSATTTLQVLVQAQDTAQRTTYSLSVTRADPSENNLASAIQVFDARGNLLSFENDVTYDKDTRNYRVRIPYSSETMSITVMPDDKVAQEARVLVAGGSEQIQQYNGGTAPLRFELLTPISDATEKQFAITAQVKSEKGIYTETPYSIEVIRNDPDRDSSVIGMQLLDQDRAAIPTFSFNPQTESYNISVPFKTDTAILIPQPRSPLARVVVNGLEFDQYNTEYVTELRAGEAKNLIAEIYPEDRGAAPRVYAITITRSLASTDARLRSLTSSGEDFSPATFDPNKTLYSVDIPEGSESITFTAVPAVASSTMVINGEALASGTASAPYAPLDAETQVEIVVTAEDGKTTLSYIIRVTNKNLVPKSNDSDLRSLTVNYGDMTPAFKPAVTEYEVAVKADTASVDILPVPRSDEATVKVFLGTRQLGDYYDNYSAAIVEGENVFTIEVTPETGTAPKVYTVTVYRNDESKQGIYKPIDAEMVNYEQEGDEIVVDISKYAVVSAEVFNTLYEEYPQKTLVFQGNDYTLRLRGKDLSKLIPHEQVYDFGLTFTSPDEDDIWEIIESEPRNYNLEPVFVHFNHHGALPGPMTMTLSLGRQYRNLSATWNYYNDERDRIDFYGGVRSNSRGTFTVNLTHMSTYIFCKDRIVNAENKSSEQVGGITNGGTAGKQNPNTGGAN